jgi:SAM-dependent methyltransferase
MPGSLATTTEREAEEARIRQAYARRPQDGRDSWFNAGHVFMLQERERQVLRLFAHEAFDRLDEKRILDIGCGRGQWLRDLVKWGARPEQITGVDLLPDRVAEARQGSPSGVTVLCGNAAHLDVPDASFDLVIQSTVFTSILDATLREAVAREMIRLLRRDGLILWYDYHVDNPSNPDVRGVGKREIQRLFPECSIHLQRVTLAPPLARALAPYSTLACHLLHAVPLLRTHYLGAIRKRHPGDGAGA